MGQDSKLGIKERIILWVEVKDVVMVMMNKMKKGERFMEMGEKNVEKRM